MRSFLLTLASLALVAGLAAPAVADDTEAATAAMEWVAGQASADGMFSSGQDPDTGDDEPDYGLSLDAALAGVAMGTDPATLSTWLDMAEPAFAAHSDDVGLVAKTLVTLMASGGSPTEYGGLDPLAMTQAAVDADGRAADANVFGQSFAMLGLAGADALPVPTVEFLASQQCSSGAFPMYFGDAGHCDATDATPDPDGTAMAVMALRAAEEAGIAEAGAPLGRAVEWLVAQQEADGSFAGTQMATPAPNTNSSGLVAAALSGLEPEAVERIGAWVASLQLDEGPHAGAIAYDPATLAAAVGGEISPLGRGRWIRSTAQGVFALAPVSFHDLGQPAADPFTTPGEHRADGQRWRTECDDDQCRTQVWATLVRAVDGRFRLEAGWHSHRLTPLADAQAG